MLSFKQFLLTEGTQKFAGDVSETIAAASLIHNHIAEKYKKSEENQNTLEKAHNTFVAAIDKMKPEDAKNRIQHGHEMAKEIHSHLKSLYPEHDISEVHISNKDGDIAKATKGKYKDSDKVNPSDLTIGLQHKKTKETIYHGISLKSTEGTSDIGFKNPSPKHMDDALGTNTVKMHHEAQKELEDRHPELKGLPGKSTSGEKDKKSVIAASEDIQKSAKEIKDKHYAKIRDHIVDTLNKHLSKGQEGHNKVKKFLADNYLNSEANTMKYSKVTAMGKGDNVKTKSEVPSESRVAALLKHPKSKLHVSAGGGNSYIHYHATDPDSGEKVHLFSEQVKTSSGFGYSSARHNIQPPGKNT